MTAVHEGILLIVVMLLSLLIGSWGTRSWSLSLAMLPWLGFIAWVSWWIEA